MKKIWIGKIAKLLSHSIFPKRSVNIPILGLLFIIKLSKPIGTLKMTHLSCDFKLKFLFKTPIHSRENGLFHDKDKEK